MQQDHQQDSDESNRDITLTRSKLGPRLTDPKSKTQKRCDQSRLFLLKFKKIENNRNRKITALQFIESLPNIIPVGPYL